jgi:uncharacterized protein YecE (DUF72 family)
MVDVQPQHQEQVEQEEEEDVIELEEKRIIVVRTVDSQQSGRKLTRHP